MGTDHLIVHHYRYVLEQAVRELVELMTSTRMAVRAGILGGECPLEVGQVVALVLQHLFHRLAQ